MVISSHFIEKCLHWGFPKKCSSLFPYCFSKESQWKVLEKSQFNITLKMAVPIPFYWENVLIKLKIPLIFILKVAWSFQQRVLSI